MNITETKIFPVKRNKTCFSPSIYNAYNVIITIYKNTEFESVELDFHYCS